MEFRWKIALMIFDLVAPLAAGYAMKRARWATPGFFDRMMLWNLMILATVMVGLSVWTLEGKLDLVWLPALGVAQQAVAGLVGYVATRGRRTPPRDQGSYILSAMLSNRGVVGVLSVFILFGEAGYGYSQIVMLLAGLVTYLVCFPLARYYQHSGLGPAGRGPGLGAILLSKTQMPVLGVILGAALNAANVPRPEILGQVFPYLVHVSAWLFTLPLGYSMDFGEMRRYWKTMLELSAIKFLLTPIVSLALGMWVGLSKPVLVTLVILGASPTAINAVIAAKLHDLNVHLSMAVFVLTTVVYLMFVLPVLLWVFGG